MLTKLHVEALQELTAWVVQPCLMTTASLNSGLKSPDKKKYSDLTSMPKTFCTSPWRLLGDNKVPNSISCKPPKLNSKETVNTLTKFACLPP